MVNRSWNVCRYKMEIKTIHHTEIETMVLDWMKREFTNDHNQNRKSENKQFDRNWLPFFHRHCQNEGFFVVVLIANLHGPTDVWLSGKYVNKIYNPRGILMMPLAHSIPNTEANNNNNNFWSSSRIIWVTSHDSIWNCLLLLLLCFPYYVNIPNSHVVGALWSKARRIKQKSWMRCMISPRLRHSERYLWWFKWKWPGYVAQYQGGAPYRTSPAKIDNIQSLLKTWKLSFHLLNLIYPME